MNTKTKYLGLATILSTAASAATLPSFDGEIKLSQDASRLVTVEYTLATASAVVTVDFLTNGVSIGAANFANNLYGDVNRLVPVGEHKIFWRPDLDWPGHRFDNGEVTAKVRAWPIDDPPLYMIVDLQTKNTVTYSATEEGVPGGVNSATYKTTKMLMRRLPLVGRNWQLGESTKTIGSWTTKVPYTVSFTNDYYMAVFPLTNKQYDLVGSPTYTSIYPSSSYTPKAGWNLDWLPVTLISYCTSRGTTVNWPNDGHKVDSGSYLGMLRALTGVEFDLPTEALWETACRAGTTTLTYLGSTYIQQSTGSDVKAPFDDFQVNKGTANNYGVGAAKPNSWGLYGMSGRANHYVLDWFADRTSDDGSVKVDPVGPATGTQRTIMGGAWGNYGATYSAQRMGVKDRSISSEAYAPFITTRYAAPAIAK